MFEFECFLVLDHGNQFILSLFIIDFEIKLALGPILAGSQNEELLFLRLLMFIKESNLSEHFSHREHFHQVVNHSDLDPNLAQLVLPFQLSCSEIDTRNYYDIKDEKNKVDLG